MKFSKFNLIIKNNEESVLFNTLTGHCFRISDSMIPIINENRTNQLEKSIYNDFVAKGIIIEDKVQEDRMFDYFRNKSRFSVDYISATILLTWSCNLACVYCYEGAGSMKEMMSMSTADDFIGFMINQAKRKNLKNMFINLFGGEPLINIDCGLYIISELKKYCNENNLIFSAGIISNGTLLTQEIIDKLVEYNCKQIQVTLDGMPATHNARRVYKNGQGSFEQIMNALRMLNENSSKIHTVIRVNVDKNNLEEVSKLLKYLGKDVKNLTNCSVDFGIVRGSTNACSAYSGNCLSEDLIGEVLEKLWNEAETEGFKMYTRPFQKWIYCGLYADNQYTITPNGDLYKCWEHAGDEHHLMGKINRNGNIDDIRYPFYDWMSSNPLEIKECQQCVYLPACGGGCGVLSYNKSKTYHEKGCFKVKGVLEKQIMRYVAEVK
ncbi:MAG: SPASM domain-containing protein [Eubacterium sp.]|nr:SPASM domain-containing protein [Eubacterium sp.]